MLFILYQFRRIFVLFFFVLIKGFGFPAHKQQVVFVDPAVLVHPMLKRRKRIGFAAIEIHHPEVPGFGLFEFPAGFKTDFILPGNPLNRIKPVLAAG